MKKIFFAIFITTVAYIAVFSWQALAAGLEQTPAVMTAKVERTLSTDTILLKTGEKVRLIGLKAVDVPPRRDVEHDEYGFVIPDNDPSNTLEEEAFQFVQHLLAGKEVRLEFDREKKGEDFKLVAYVFLVSDNTFVNAEILRQGYATLSLTPPNLKYAEALRAAYREAREERRGLHAE